MNREDARFGRPDLAVVIKRHIAAILTGETSVSKQFRDATVRSGHLPIFCDMGGCLLLATDGRVHEFDFEANEVKPVEREADRRFTYAEAARVYIDLSALREEVGSRCDVCGGSGWIVVRSVRCSDCDGTGRLAPS